MPGRSAPRSIAGKPLRRTASGVLTRPAGRHDPREARLLLSFEASHTDEGQLDRLASALGCLAPPERMDSQAKYAVMASGKADMLFRLISPARPDYRAEIWDQAAGSIIVAEARGRVTDLEGKAL